METTLISRDARALYQHGLYFCLIGILALSGLAIAEDYVQPVYSWMGLYGLGGAICGLGMMKFWQSRKPREVMRLSEDGVVFLNKDGTKDLWLWQDMDTVAHGAGRLTFTFKHRARPSRFIETSGLTHSASQIMQVVKARAPHIVI